MKLQTRRLEKAYRRHPSVTALSAWRSQFQHQRALLQRKFLEYWSHAISSTGNDTKALWQKLKCLLSQHSTVHSHFLANQFLSRLDYGNAVLAGLPQSTIAPLQRVLNAAARLVLGL